MKNLILVGRQRKGSTIWKVNTHSPQNSKYHQQHVHHVQDCPYPCCHCHYHHGPNASVSYRLSANYQSSLEFQECLAPQQQNGYDCGVHTLGTAHALAQAIAVTETSSSFNYQSRDLEGIVKASVGSSPLFCSKLRQQIAKTVEELAGKL